MIRKHGSAIDESFAPNLAQSAIDSQTVETFGLWLNYHFPAYIASWGSHIDLSWMEFIRERWRLFPHALTWAIRALITLHMGAISGNENAVQCARHLYSHGIKHLAVVLGTSFALSDESLAAAILLGGYEVLDGHDSRSWIRHSRGIREIICARGPSAHLRGMGRTLLLSWRPYLIAESFVLREPCFLGNHGWEWVFTVKNATAADQTQYRNRLEGIIEDSFREVVKCPAYYAGVRKNLELYRSSGTASSENLKIEIAKSKKIFFECKKTLGLRLWDPRIDTPIPTTRSIPSHFIEAIRRESIRGIDDALALLDRLTKALSYCGICCHLGMNAISDANFLTRSHSSHQQGFSRKQDFEAIAQVKAFSQGPRGFNPRQLDVGDKLDLFCLNMGMGTSSVDNCGLKQFLAY